MGSAYYFEVAGFNNTRTGAYEVELIAPGEDPNADLHGDDRASASPLNAVGEPMAAAIEESGDIDYFSMTANAAGRWQVESSGNLDVVCSLEDAEGTLLATNDDGGVGSNCLVAHELEVGQEVFHQDPRLQRICYRIVQFYCDFALALTSGFHYSAAPFRSPIDGK